MEAKRAVRWAAYYRGIATLSFIVGMGIAAYGFSTGLGETLDILINNYPAQQDEAQAAANVPLAVGSIVVGLLVWQVGKSVAFYWTLASAVDEATGADGASAAGVAASPPREPADPEPRSGPAATPGDDPVGSVDGRAAPSDEPAGAPRTTNPDPVGQGDGSVAPADDRTGSDAAAPETDEPVRSGSERDSPSDAGVADDSAGGESESTPEVSDEPVAGESDSDAGTRTGTPTAGDEGSARTGAAPAEETDDRRTSADAGATDESTAAAEESDAGGGDDAPDGVACPDCGYTNKDNVSFCMNCGTEL